MKPLPGPGCRLEAGARLQRTQGPRCGACGCKLQTVREAAPVGKRRGRASSRLHARRGRAWGRRSASAVALRRPARVGGGQRQVPKGHGDMRTSTSAALSAMALARARRAAEAGSRTHTLWERRERVRCTTNGTKSKRLACMPRWQPTWVRIAVAQCRRLAPHRSPPAPCACAGALRVAQACKRPPHLPQIAASQMRPTCQPHRGPHEPSGHGASSHRSSSSYCVHVCSRSVGSAVPRSDMWRGGRCSEQCLEPQRRIARSMLRQDLRGRCARRGGGA